jgi:hypothetical protein
MADEMARAKDCCACCEAPWWERLEGEALQAEYRHIDDNLTAELCTLSMHLTNFVERRLVAEAVDRTTPRSEEGFRLGEKMEHVGLVLMSDSRRWGKQREETDARRV